MQVVPQEIHYSQRCFAGLQFKLSGSFSITGQFMASLLLESNESAQAKDQSSNENVFCEWIGKQAQTPM